MNSLLIAVLALIWQAAPVRGYSLLPDNSTDITLNYSITNAVAVNNSIAALKVKAEEETVSVSQEVEELKKFSEISNEFLIIEYKYELFMNIYIHCFS